MFRRAKKTLSVAYKDKLLADIAYYEKRIEEALLKKKHNSFDYVESDESCPYTINIEPSGMELRQREASLSDRASMTLELAMLTVMQSEVNVMVSPPDVRKPVEEDGTWLEVVAECKIDLVSFTISFYAHKPRRLFAPIRYRNVLVSLVKTAHERELAQSVLSKLNRPNLALQVLQSYATAFRSRRTTLLELAERYEDRLRMEALPEGGYRVRFLGLLTVDWTLENMWSPVVPFCHRMKFEVEFMPKNYIHAIGKLYKQFKDPSLETAERTDTLAKIFDICLEAQGPARDLQESLQSDPETAGQLHERRTTIDQEPDVPNCDQHVSPRKQPKGKENKAQNRKTTMAPPKTIPKKAKKVANVKNTEVSKISGDTGESNVSKENRLNGDRNNVENRKGVKRGLENDGNTDAKKVRTEEKDTVKAKIKNTKTNAKNVEEHSEDNNEGASGNSKSNEKDDNSKISITTNKNNDKSTNSEVKKKPNVSKKAVNPKSKTNTDKSTKNSAKEVDAQVKAIKISEKTKPNENTARQSQISAKSKESSKYTTNKENDNNSKNKATDDASKNSKNINDDNKNSNKQILNKVSSKSMNEKAAKLTDAKKLKRKIVASSKKEVNLAGSEIALNKGTQETDNNKKTKLKETTTKTITKGDKTKSDDNKVIKQTKVTKLTENNKKTKEIKEVVNEKQNDKIKEPVQNKVNQNKMAENIDKDKAQKIKTNKNALTQSTDNKKNTNNNNIKKPLSSNVQKAKPIPSKVSKIQEKSSAVKNHETIEKIVTNNAKVAKANDQKCPKMFNKPQKLSLTKMVTAQSEKFTKFAENQAKIVDKLKTKIPMMKKASNIEKLGVKSVGKIAKNDVEKKTKIPMKSLPVFKKSAKCLPTRISPRKLPSTFRPPPQGFSIK